MKRLSNRAFTPFAARISSVLAAAGLITAILGASAANAGDTLPGYQVLPQNEDWSVLRDYDGPPDLFNPIKYVPLNENGDMYLSFGGQLRERVEGWNGFNFGNTGTSDDDDVYLLHRLLFHGDLHLGKHVRFFLQGINALSTDRDLPGGKRKLDVNEIDFQNAFVQVGGGEQSGIGSLTARVGRQGLLFGNERLVSPLDWANTQRMFHAATVSVNLNDWQTTAFGSELVKVRKYALDKREKSTNFYGVYGTNTSIMNLQAFDLYYLFLDNENAVWNGTNGDEDRHTLGFRLHGDMGQSEVMGELEGAYQFGEVGNDDIEAFMFTGQVDWSVQPLNPDGLRILLGAGYASGDGSNGGKVGTFNQLFPLGHKYLGYIDTVGRQNVINSKIGAKIGTLFGITAGMDFFYFWRAKTSDALYNAGGGVAIPGNANGKRDVGSELDFTFKRGIGRHLSVLAGYSHFFAGDFVKHAPGKEDDIDFGYLQLEYTM